MSLQNCTHNTHIFFFLFLFVLTRSVWTQSHICYIPQISLWLCRLDRLSRLHLLEWGFVMIIGRKEQRQACTQLLEQKTFTGTRRKKLAEKKNLTVTDFEAYSRKYLFLMAWMFAFFFIIFLEKIFIFEGLDVVDFLFSISSFFVTRVGIKKQK